MPLVRKIAFATTLIALAAASFAHAQVTMVEPGFLGTTLSNDFAKQVEVAGGGLPDTCLWYGSNEGLRRRCQPLDPGTICDPTLTFPAGIAFSTAGSFGAYTYVSDFGQNGIYRMTGCSTATLFASIFSAGSIAFPPSGSAYGDYLYGCAAYSGPISRISSAGVVTSWLSLPALYLKFGPGGAWGDGLYATEFGTPGTQRIVNVSSAGAVTPFLTGLGIAEGFDWGFDGDMFACDYGANTLYRVKSDGNKTVFATIPGVADVAYRPGEQALYVVSVNGGLYSIRRAGTTAVPMAPLSLRELSVAPNPTRSGCTIRLALANAGVTRTQVVDAAGRRVRQLADAWRPAGEQAIAWDGRDDSGVAVRPGTYFARVTNGGIEASARVTIVR